MRDWYLEEEEFLSKYDAGEPINERCLLEYAYGGKEISVEDPRRWSQYVTVVFNVLDRCFKIKYDRGLTESQENECYEQPVEVKKVEWDEVIPEHIVHRVYYEPVA